MSRVRVAVNGTEYTSVVEGLDGQITLSSSKHDKVFVTTLYELQTQYGVKTAYFVQQALGTAKQSKMVEALAAKVSEAIAKAV